MSELSISISLLAGILVSLFWRYVPKAKLWFNSLDPDNHEWTKQIVILVSSLVAALIIFGVGCSGYGAQYGFPQTTCDLNGAVHVFVAFLFIVVGTQTTYPLVKK